MLLHISQHVNVNSGAPATMIITSSGKLSRPAPTPPGPFGPVKGLVVHRGAVAPDDVRVMDKTRVTSPVRTCWDLAHWLDPVEAVVILDNLVSKRVVSVADMLAYAQARSGQRGWARLINAARLVDGKAESPQESRLRVRLAKAGLVAPVAQFVINDRAGFVARVDLAWPELKIALEYDGAWHADRRQLERDRARLNRLVAAGRLVLHVTADRMRNDFDGIVGEVRTAMRSRERVGVGR